ncbi:MAG: flagellar cap protein FliD N-terminal domain-containing protein, partial [bacterium]
MSVTFSGIGSGLPVQQLIDATMKANSYRLNSYTKNKDDYTKQQNAYKTVEAKYRSFDSTLQKVVDSKMIYAFDLFDRKSVEVSDKSVASVSVGQGALSGSVELKVNSLAKPPITSASNFAGPITSSINLSQLGIIDGTFAFAFETPTGALSIEQDIISGDTLESFINKVNQKITDDTTLDG